MQTRLSENPDIRHTEHHKTFDKTQNLNKFSSMYLDTPVSSSAETVNVNEAVGRRHKNLDQELDNLATANKKSKEAHQITTRGSILKTRNLLVTEITAKEKARNIISSIKNRIQIRHYFHGGENFPDLFFFKNNKRKEKEFVILCDTLKYAILIALVITSIAILSLMSVTACLIINYKFSILKRNIIRSIRLLKNSFEKNSRCNHKHFSMELSYYANKLQPGEKVHENREPFIQRKS